MEDPRGSIDARERGQELAAQRAHLWGLCYRLTGDAAAADDLVQDTFERALSRPPAQPWRPWRPWLTRVATNLALDLLRRRRHQAYTGPWLPSPVPTAALETLEYAASDDLERRYGLRESATIAFLLALERLDPRQRVVLVLADVVGHSGPEIADLLGLRASHVRQILSRARAALRPYEAAPCRPTLALAEAHRRALEGFFGALAAGDVEAMTRHLVEEVVYTSDGGGEFHAAYKPVQGARRVVALQIGLAKRAPAPLWAAQVEMNGLPALLFVLPDRADPRLARRVLVRVELEPGGEQIIALQIVLATAKLKHVEFGA